MSGRIKKILKHPKLLFFTLGHHGFLNFISDQKYIEIAYKIKFGKKLNLENPQTFNEKIQWLKLYNRKDIFTTMVDKYAVKQYVSDIIGEEYVIKNIGVWERAEDIDFDSLPDKFVLKCNHDSGNVIVCRDKSSFDYASAKKKLRKGLKYNAYSTGREWPYKNVKRCILAEEFVKDDSNDCLPVYKIFCFGGRAKIIQTIQNDKQSNESIDYFDTDWNLLDLKQNFPNSEKPFEKPEKLDEMLTLAEKLAGDESFIRVDFYIANDKIYFSEFTFFSDSGFAKFEPSEWDFIYGSWIDLDNGNKSK